MPDGEPTLTALHHGRSSPWLEAPVHEPDVATWAWHRAAGVTAGLRLPPAVGRPLAVAVPLVVLVGGSLAAGLTLVDAVLVLALLVVTPAGTALLPDVPVVVPRATLATGAVAAAGLLLVRSSGFLAAAVTVPWVLTAAGGAVLAFGRWRTLRWRARGVVPVVACGYLAFGSLWLLADRLAFEPAGFGPPFVQLTAVHFVYAGFVATVLADRAWARRPDDRVAALAVVTIAAAPPVVAVGFVAFGALQIVGAGLLTVGAYALAWVTLRHIVPTAPRPAAWLLGLSSVSVVAPMLLAVQWAVGANLGTPALTIPQMAATHGVANAVGFALLGVLGWRLVPRASPAADDGGDG